MLPAILADQQAQQQRNGEKPNPLMNWTCLADETNYIDHATIHPPTARGQNNTTTLDTRIWTIIMYSAIGGGAVAKCGKSLQAKANSRDSRNSIV